MSKLMVKDPDLDDHNPETPALSTNASDLFQLELDAIDGESFDWLDGWNAIDAYDWDGTKDSVLDHHAPSDVVVSHQDVQADLCLEKEIVTELHRDIHNSDNPEVQIGAQAPTSTTVLDYDTQIWSHSSQSTRNRLSPVVESRDTLFTATASPPWIPDHQYAKANIAAVTPSPTPSRRVSNLFATDKTDHPNDIVIENGGFQQVPTVYDGNDETASPADTEQVQMPRVGNIFSAETQFAQHPAANLIAESHGEELNDIVEDEGASTRWVGLMSQPTPTATPRDISTLQEPLDVSINAPACHPSESIDSTDSPTTTQDLLLTSPQASPLTNSQDVPDVDAKGSGTPAASFQEPEVCDRQTWPASPRIVQGTPAETRLDDDLQDMPDSPSQDELRVKPPMHLSAQDQLTAGHSNTQDWQAQLQIAAAGYSPSCFPETPSQPNETGLASLTEPGATTAVEETSAVHSPWVTQVYEQFISTPRSSVDSQSGAPYDETAANTPTPTGLDEGLSLPNDYNCEEDSDIASGIPSLPAHVVDSEAQSAGGASSPQQDGSQAALDIYQETHIESEPRSEATSAPMAVITSELEDASIGSPHHDQPADTAVVGFIHNEQVFEALAPVDTSTNSELEKGSLTIEAVAIEAVAVVTTEAVEDVSKDMTRDDQEHKLEPVANPVVSPPPQIEEEVMPQQSDINVRTEVVSEPIYEIDTTLSETASMNTTATEEILADALERILTTNASPDSSQLMANEDVPTTNPAESDINSESVPTPEHFEERQPVQIQPKEMCSDLSSSKEVNLTRDDTAGDQIDNLSGAANMETSHSTAVEVRPSTSKTIDNPSEVEDNVESGSVDILPASQAVEVRVALADASTSAEDQAQNGLTNTSSESSSTAAEGERLVAVDTKFKTDVKTESVLQPTAPLEKSQPGVSDSFIEDPETIPRDCEVQSLVSTTSEESAGHMAVEDSALVRPSIETSFDIKIEASVSASVNPIKADPTRLRKRSISAAGTDDGSSTEHKSPVKKKPKTTTPVHYSVPQNVKRTYLDTNDTRTDQSQPATVPVSDGISRNRPKQFIDAGETASTEDEAPAKKRPRTAALTQSPTALHIDSFVEMRARSNSVETPRTLDDSRAARAIAAELENADVKQVTSPEVDMISSQLASLTYGQSALLSGSSAAPIPTTDPRTSNALNLQLPLNDDDADTAAALTAQPHQPSTVDNIETDDNPVEMSSSSRDEGTIDIVDADAEEDPTLNKTPDINTASDATPGPHLDRRKPEQLTLDRGSTSSLSDIPSDSHLSDADDLLPLPATTPVAANAQSRVRKNLVGDGGLAQLSDNTLKVDKKRKRMAGKTPVHKESLEIGQSTTPSAMHEDVEMPTGRNLGPKKRQAVALGERKHSGTTVMAETRDVSTNLGTEMKGDVERQPPKLKVKLTLRNTPPIAPTSKSKTQRAKRQTRQTTARAASTPEAIPATSLDNDDDEGEEAEEDESVSLPIPSPAEPSLTEPRAELPSPHPFYPGYNKRQTRSDTRSEQPSPHTSSDQTSSHPTSTGDKVEAEVDDEVEVANTPNPPHLSMHQLPGPPPTPPVHNELSTKKPPSKPPRAPAKASAPGKRVGNGAAGKTEGANQYGFSTRGRSTAVNPTALASRLTAAAAKASKATAANAEAKAEAEAKASVAASKGGAKPTASKPSTSTSDTDKRQTRRASALERGVLAGAGKEKEAEVEKERNRNGRWRKKRT